MPMLWIDKTGLCMTTDLEIVGQWDILAGPEKYLDLLSCMQYKIGLGTSGGCIGYSILSTCQPHLMAHY